MIKHPLVKILCIPTVVFSVAFLITKYIGDPIGEHYGNIADIAFTLFTCVVAMFISNALVYQFVEKDRKKELFALGLKTTTVSYEFALEVLKNNLLGPIYAQHDVIRGTEAHLKVIDNFTKGETWEEFMALREDVMQAIANKDGNKAMADIISLMALLHRTQSKY